MQSPPICDFPQQEREQKRKKVEFSVRKAVSLQRFWYAQTMLRNTNILLNEEMKTAIVR